MSKLHSLFVSIYIPIRNSVFYLIPVVIYFYKITQFINNNQTFYYYWDWPGHIDKALKLGWLPWTTGWDTTFWGGYSTYTYPPLAHYLLKILLSILELKSAVISLLVIFFVIQLIAFYKLASLHTQLKSIKVLIFAGLLLASLAVPPRYLGSFLGTLTTGGFSANLGISLLLFLITAKNAYLKTIWCGLLLLTHSLTGFIGILYTVIFHFLAIYKNKSNRHHPTSHLIPLILIFGIAAPWIVPFIDPSFKGSPENISGGDIFLPIVYILIITLTRVSQKKTSAINIALGIIALMTLLPDRLLYQLKQIGISGLHIYRFHFYLILFTIATKWQLFINSKILRKQITFYLVLMAILVLTLYQSVPSRNFKFEFDQNKVNQLHGRILNVTSMSMLPDYPHLFEELLTQQNNRLIGSQGLFYESSQRGLQYYELANQLQPNTFKNGTFGIFFNNSEGKPWQDIDTYETAQLLGINFVVYVDKPEVDRTYGQVIGRILQDDREVFEIVTEEYQDHTLAETLDQLPTVNPQQDLGTWWLDTNHHQLFTRAPVAEASDTLDINKPHVQVTDVSPQSISLNIDSPTPAPVILKFTYSKYWTSQPLDDMSTSSQPTWITPGHIFLIGNGNVELTWKPPTYIILCYSLSLISLCYSLIKYRLNVINIPKK